MPLYFNVVSTFCHGSALIWRKSSQKYEGSLKGHLNKLNVKIKKMFIAFFDGQIAEKKTSLNKFHGLDLRPLE